MDANPTTAARPRIRFVKRALFALLPLVAMLIVFEPTARCLVSETTLAKRFEQIEQLIVFLGNEPRESLFQPDRDCFWRLKPNVVAPIERGRTWGGIMSNSHGLRSREISLTEADPRTRVLCFGDSTTFSFGVDFADAWPNQLQALLDQESSGQVEVLNAGIPGHTSFQGRQRLGGDLKKWRPHLTVITFGNNDGWRWDGLADKDHAMPSANLATKLLDHSRAWSWLKSSWLQTVQRNAIQDESRWPEQATRNYFDPNTNWTPRVGLPDFADNLRAMIELCQHHFSDVVLVVWPDQRQLLGQPTWRLPYQEATRQVAEATGVECVDLVPLFERSLPWSANRFIPNDVIHLDRAGNQLVAKTIAPCARTLQSRPHARLINASKH